MIKVFVIHVKGAESRAKHIKAELNKFNIDFDFILDGNKDDINEEQLSKYFKGDMHTVSAPTSCALKHIYAYENIAKNNIPQALIFEDDITLSSNFNQILQKILLEIEQDKLTNYLISLENSNHTYVSKTEALPNKYLYKKTTGRCAGAYIIDLQCAKSILLAIDQNKCALPIDWYHNELSASNSINIYWSYPHIAEQGSLSGRMPSLIDNKKTGWFKRTVFFFQGKIRSRLKHQWE